MRIQRCAIVVLVVLATIAGEPGTVFTGDLFFDIPLNEIKITFGELPKPRDESNSFHVDPRWPHMRPTVALDAAGEAYLSISDDQLWAFRFQGAGNLTTSHVLIRGSPKGNEIVGQMSLPTHEPGGMKLVKFSVSPTAAKGSAREAFY